MSKKKPQKPVEKPAMTKKQLSRLRRERRQERLALAFVIIVICLVTGVLAFGFYQENIVKPNLPIAKVNGIPITLITYAKAIDFQKRVLDQQEAYWQEQYQRFKASEDQAFLAQLAQQQLSQIQRARQQLYFSVPEDLIADELIRQETEKRNLTVSPAEVEEAIVKAFQPAAGEPVTDTASIIPTPTPIPPDAWQQKYKQYLSSLRLSDAEYRQLAILPLLRREKLQRALSETVPSSAEQIRLSHIVTDTREAAEAILARLQAGEDFATLAKELSSDASSAAAGGDIGWYPPGILAYDFGDAFEKAAFALQKGQIVTAPVASLAGYHILMVTDREINRPIDADKRAQLQATAVDRWLKQQKASPAVEWYLDSDKVAWVSTQVAKWSGQDASRP